MRNLKNSFANVYFWCIIIFLVSFIPRIINLEEPGLTWDEPAYIEAGKKYIEGILNLRLFDVSTWRSNWEHPPLAKYLIGISIHISRSFNISEVTAARIPNAILGSLTCVLMYLFLRETYIEGLSILASLILSFLPRFFAHTRYAALDAPETFFGVFSIYAFQKGIEMKSNKWILFSAFLLGASFSVKISALSLPLIFLTWLIIVYWDKKIETSSLLKIIFLLPSIALTTFILLWPLLWIKPEHAIMYFNFHIHHFNIPVYYLGKVYWRAPWHYPFVVLFATTPFLITLSTILGIIYTLKKFFKCKSEISFLLLIWLVLTLLRTSISYGYDGVRLFLDALPAMTALAAIGIAWFTIFLRRLFKATFKKSKIIFLLLSLTLITSEVYACITTHPYETSYYNEALMAFDLVKYFEKTYWGEVYREVVEWLETHAPGSNVVVPIASHLPQYYAKTLKITNNIYDVFGDRNSYFVFQAREGFYMRAKELIDFCLRNLKPVHTIQVNGINIAYIFNLKDYYSLYANTQAANALLKLNQDLSNGKAVTIDLRKYANRSFKDNIPDDGQGGWVDDGINDLRYIPTGHVTFDLVSNLLGKEIKIPFEIISQGNSCIILGSRRRDFFPKKVLKINVNLKNVSGLVFLQTCVWSSLDGKTVARYVVKYTDGEEIEIPIIYGKNVKDWWLDPTPIEGAMPAWIGSNNVHRPITVYLYPWINPKPLKTIESIDFISEWDEAVPVLIAITAIWKG